MASGDKFYIADKATLDEVKGKIGSTTDTGGSSTAGTVMAKENAVLGEVGKIGASNDAGNSNTTGTTVSIFAKLNYLVSQVSSYLSNIYSRIGSQSDAANSATSASAHGKLNWFINLFGKTDDTGATATTGSIMAKENAILVEANKIGNPDDVGGTTLFGKLNFLPRTKVQRGVVSLSYTNPARSISISPINPEKTLIVISGSTYIILTDGSIEVNAYVSNVTANSFTINLCTSQYGTKNAASSSFSWELVEYKEG